MSLVKTFTKIGRQMMLLDRVTHCSLFSSTSSSVPPAEPAAACGLSRSL
jgi:hypothetical protein